jgi:hypothetical protein
MMGNRGPIELLDWEKARRLILALLGASPALSELRASRTDPLWPLNETQIREIFLDGQAPARTVISRCKDLFDLWRTGVAEPPVPIETALHALLEERFSIVSTQDSETALRNGLPLLFRALGTALKPPPGISPFDFVSQDSQTIALCNQAGRGLEAKLRRVRDAWRPVGPVRLTLLRDARLPIGPQAKLTRQHLDSIQSHGGQFVPVSQEAIAALAALHRLLSDAKSGDLGLAANPNPVDTVERWITGNLPAALDPLIAAIRSSHPLSGKLAELLALKKIISLEEAARELLARPAEVESCARLDPRLFGLLGGPAPALFQPASSDTPIPPDPCP